MFDILIPIVVVSFAVLFNNIFLSWLYSKKIANLELKHKESINSVINHAQAMAMIYKRSKEVSNEPLTDNDKRLLEKIDKETLSYYFNKNGKPNK